MDKKKIGSIIGIIALIGLLVLSFIIGSDNNDNQIIESEDPDTIYKNAQIESSTIKESEMKDYINIDMSTYLEKYHQEESSFVLIGRDSCEYCKLAEPILKKLSKDYNFDIHYLNTDTFTIEDRDSLLNSDEFFNESFGTPLILIVGQGKIIGHVDGLTDTSHYIKFLRESNFIAE